jgi:hypothetical protein
MGMRKAENEFGSGNAEVGRLEIRGYRGLMLEVGMGKVETEFGSRNAEGGRWKDERSKVKGAR